MVVRGTVVVGLVVVGAVDAGDEVVVSAVVLVVGASAAVDVGVDASGGGGTKTVVPAAVGVARAVSSRRTTLSDAASRPASATNRAMAAWTEPLWAPCRVGRSPMSAVTSASTLAIDWPRGAGAGAVRAARRRSVVFKVVVVGGTAESSVAVEPPS